MVAKCYTVCRGHSSPHFQSFLHMFQWPGTKEFPSSFNFKADLADRQPRWYRAPLSIYLSICLSVCLSVCPSVGLSVCLSPCLPIYRSIHPSIHPSLDLSLSLYLSIYLSFYLSICLSVYLSICLSVYLSIYLSFYLSIYVHNLPKYIPMISHIADVHVEATSPTRPKAAFSRAAPHQSWGALRNRPYSGHSVVDQHVGSMNRCIIPYMGGYMFSIYIYCNPVMIHHTYIVYIYIYSTVYIYIYTYIYIYISHIHFFPYA